MEYRTLLHGAAYGPAGELIYRGPSRQSALSAGRAVAVGQTSEIIADGECIARYIGRQDGEPISVVVWTKFADLPAETTTTRGGGR